MPFNRLYSYNYSIGYTVIIIQQIIKFSLSLLVTYNYCAPVTQSAVPLSGIVYSYDEFFSHMNVQECVRHQWEPSLAVISELFLIIVVFESNIPLSRSVYKIALKAFLQMILLHIPSVLDCDSLFIL